MAPSHPSKPARQCGNCGTPCPAPFRAPAAELAPDLDGRPGEPARSTLSRWVVTCRTCGAAAPDLAALPSTLDAVLGSAAYRAEPSRFLRWAAIATELGELDAAAEAVLQAAWMLDDKGEDSSALRRRAAALGPGMDTLRRIDILRRAGSFAEASALAGGYEPPDESARAIVAFQRDRIAAGDGGRHMISSALRPPARRPHAASQPATAAPKGWFARLVGR